MINRLKQGVLFSVVLLSGVGLFQSSTPAKLSDETQEFYCPESTTIAKFKGKGSPVFATTPSSPDYTCVENEELTCGSANYGLRRVSIGATMPPDENIIYPTSTNPDVTILTGTPNTIVKTAAVTICKNIKTIKSELERRDRIDHGVICSDGYGIVKVLEPVPEIKKDFFQVLVPSQLPYLKPEEKAKHGMEYACLKSKYFRCPVIFPLGMGRNLPGRYGYLNFTQMGSPRVISHNDLYAEIVSNRSLILPFRIRPVRLTPGERMRSHNAPYCSRTRQ